MPDIQGAIRTEGLDGWLFTNVFHRDEVSDLILDVPRDSMNTRPWVCAVFPDRPALKLVHVIERGILDGVGGETVVYFGREEFCRALAAAFPRGARVAAQCSSRFPVGSFLDHGTALLLMAAGIELVSSDEITAGFLGVLDDEGIRSHERAGKALYGIIAEVWRRLVGDMGSGKGLCEGRVRRWMEDLISENGLESDAQPLVASGKASADPHYAPQGDGRALERGNVVQFDIWAKERGAGAIYADISWVGVLSAEPEPRFARAFDAVRGARETALELIRDRLSEGRAVSGEEVDRAARSTLEDSGYAPYIRHRTGHSIGERVHGYGVNLDSVEFPDSRRLREGACFSIEPGVYLQDFGMRTEIDAYIKDGCPVVSGGEPQNMLLGMGGK